MKFKSHRIVRFLLRAILSVLIVVLCLFIYLYVSNIIQTNKWQRHPPARSVQITTKTHRASLSIKGKGSLTVIIVPGLGQASIEWWHIQDILAQKTRVFTYDRAGYAWSTKSPQERNTKNLVNELRELLSISSVKAPYILVSESIGALYCLYFAQKYPEEVRGIVLIDPISTNFIQFEKRLPKALFQNLFNRKPRIQAARAVSKLGLIRALRALPYERVPEKIVDHLVNFYSAPSTYQTMLAEYDNIGVNIQQLSTNTPFPEIPIRVIHHCPERFVEQLMFFRMSYDEAHEVENLWQQLDRETANLSRLGTLLYAKTAERDIHIREPDIIIHTISELMDGSF